MATPKSESSTSIMRYLQSCSPTTLQEFELARLNAVSNLEKQMKDILRQMVNSASEALLARMLIEHRSDPVAKAITITVEGGGNKAKGRLAGAARRLRSAQGETAGGL